MNRQQLLVLVYLTSVPHGPCHAMLCHAAKLAASLEALLCRPLHAAFLAAARLGSAHAEVQRQAAWLGHQRPSVPVCGLAKAGSKPTDASACVRAS